MLVYIYVSSSGAVLEVDETVEVVPEAALVNEAWGGEESWWELG